MKPYIAIGAGCHSWRGEITESVGVTGVTLDTRAPATALFIKKTKRLWIGDRGSDRGSDHGSEIVDLRSWI